MALKFWIKLFLFVHSSLSWHSVTSVDFFSQVTANLFLSQPLEISVVKITLERKKKSVDSLTPYVTPFGNSGRRSKSGICTPDHELPESYRKIMNVIPQLLPSFLFGDHGKGVRRWDGVFLSEDSLTTSSFVRVAAAAATLGSFYPSL